MPQQQADALALLPETALHHGIDPGSPGERYQVVVHIDSDLLADAEHAGQSVLEDGTRVRSVNIAHGVSVDSHTMTPEWLGEGLDVGWAIDVLHPLAVGSRAGA